MTNIVEKLKSTLKSIIFEKYGISIEDITILPTRKEFVGSHTFPIFEISKKLDKTVEVVGNEIGSELIKVLPINSFSIVKGFLNIEFTVEMWISILEEMGTTEEYGKLPFNGKNLLIEFSSPNTNKPLHLGHLRNNFLGDSISKIMEYTGYKVIKTNLINDRGIHICKSMVAYIEYGNNELPYSEPNFLKGDHLVGKYYVLFNQYHESEIESMVENGYSKEDASRNTPSILHAQELLEKWEKGDPEVIDLWKKMNGWVYTGFEQTYKKLGISFDKVYYESDTYLYGKEIVEEGLEKGIFFKKDDGSVWVDLSDIGLDNKLLLRENGTSVYMTQDLGTADLKYSENLFDKSLYVVGDEQIYHFKVLFEILGRLKRKYSDGLYHLAYGMVELPNGRMKSREGTVVDADDLISEMVNIVTIQTNKSEKIEGYTEKEILDLSTMIGVGALKYFLLKVDPTKKMVFFPEESIKLQGNTSPYIQYTYSRICGVIRKSEESGLKINSNLDSNIELNKYEIELIEWLEKYPFYINEASINYDPSSIAKFVYEICKIFNRFYTEVPVLNSENNNQLSFRLFLMKTCGKTIKSGMGLLGIDVPEKM